MVGGKIKIRSFVPDDWEKVLAIYLEGIATGLATFETAAPSWEKWEAGHIHFARLVAFSKENGVTGWAALGPVSSRSAYSGVAEVSLYIGNAFRGHGIGRALLEHLIEESEQNGIWTLQASILAENLPSIALHEKYGFRRIGFRERIAKLNGVWRDTVLLERRSRVV